MWNDQIFNVGIDLPYDYKQIRNKLEVAVQAKASRRTEDLSAQCKKYSCEDLPRDVKGSQFRVALTG